jgi:hypothetical protein
MEFFYQKLFDYMVPGSLVYWFLVLLVWDVGAPVIHRVTSLLRILTG